ncbi:hypothetical protein E4U21_006287 [Claviceps maximensis]|nr:hypothetical protein E4U21_006287 [Claviceps maximensis]
MPSIPTSAAPTLTYSLIGDGLSIRAPSAVLASRPYAFQWSWWTVCLLRDPPVNDMFYQTVDRRNPHGERLELRLTLAFRNATPTLAILW